jgi:hypothetical protein
MLAARVAASSATVAFGIIALAGCGQADNNPTSAHDNSPATGKASSQHGKTVYARDARLLRGARNVELLSMPGVGRLLVSCDKHGTSSTAFVASSRTATADVVVQTRDATANRELDPGHRFSPRLARANPGIEQWSVAQFSPAHATVTTMTVAMRPVTGSGHACAVSSMAFVVKQTAGSRTR